MSDCSKHKQSLFGKKDMKAVAEAIGDLHYETLAELLDKLSDKLFLDAAKDRTGGKFRLSRELEDAASNINLASIDIEKAWEISKLFMDKNNQQ